MFKSFINNITNIWTTSVLLDLLIRIEINIIRIEINYMENIKYKVLFYF